jgi:DNA-binding response OmpR family regulator
MRLTIDPEGVRVLVVDDEDYITDLIAVGLRFVGFDVDTAVDGRDALAKIASTRPDLVVLDISMPGIDGIEVLQRIRRDGVSTPVVFLTARDAFTRSTG